MQINTEQLLAMIKIGVSIAGSQKELARQMKISPQYLCDVLRGRREAGDKLLAFYGLKRVVTYKTSGKPQHLIAERSNDLKTVHLRWLAGE